MVELVDTLDLGSSGIIDVKVRILSIALKTQTMDTARALYKVLNFLELEDDALFEECLNENVGLEKWYETKKQSIRLEDKQTNQEIQEINDEDSDELDSLDTFFDN